MLKVRWEASVQVPDGELSPLEPFEGELAAGVFAGLEPQAGGGDSGQIRMESYGSQDELARCMAAWLCHAKEQGYLPAALGYAEMTSPGMVAFVLRGHAP